MVPRLAIYTALSTSLFSAVTLSALNSRPNFYAAAVAVGRNSGSMMVVWNMIIWAGLVLGLGVRRLFFGQLRSIEHEHLFERLWMFLTESLLALTIFRDDFTGPFALMYGLLVFLKCFHWITADRVDYMDQIPPPGPPTLFHIRLSTFITLLSIADLLLVLYSLDSILTYGVSAMVLFTSEYMVLLASIWGTGAKYGVNCLDLRRARGREDAPAWEEKSMWMFYIDLAVDFAKLITYLSFFTVILLKYGLPLHILRDVWMTLRSFYSRCHDLIRYRRATRDMDAQYPNATEDDVGRLGDRVCIICREEMVVTPADSADGGRGEGPNETPKKLVCGHVFHFHCLRSWLERQQSCPTCRRDVLTRPTADTRQRPGAGVQPAAAAAAAPAPGAVPQPPNQAEAMRNQFNEFFRLPQENGAAPAAPPAPGPTGLHIPPQNQNQPAPGPTQGQTVPEATGTPTSTITEPGSATSMNTVLTSSFAHLYPPTGQTQLQSQAQSNEDVEIQRSIWGGPIQPGRFHAAPLGALPRYSIPGTGAGAVFRAGAATGAGTGISNGNASGNGSGSGSGSGAAGAGEAGPSIRRQPPSRVNISAPDTTAVNQAGNGDGSLNSGIPDWSNSTNSNINLNAMASEVNTPFSSNPPEVFRSLSRSPDPDPTSRKLDTDTEETATATVEEARSKTDGNEGTSAEVQAGPETRNRRLAAEAAMRRLGITPSATLSKGKEKEKVVEPPVIANGSGTGTVPTLAAPIPPTEDSERWKPFLSIPDRGPPHPPQSTTRPGLGLRNGTDYTPRTMGVPIGSGVGREGVEGVDDRLRVLREVDDGIWKMIEDLTRLKSQWDHGDGGGDASANGHVEDGGIGAGAGREDDGERTLREGMSVFDREG